MVGNVALQVSASESENWVTYEVNSSAATGYLSYRYLAEQGSGKVEVYIDNTKKGEFSIQQGSAWVTDIISLDLPAGTHTVKLRFVETNGSYNISWLEFANDVNTAGKIRNPELNQTKILPAKNGISALLPVSHGYTSFSLIKANGQIIRRGSLSKNHHRIHFDDLANGVWFLKLERNNNSRLFKTFVNGQ